VHGHPTAKRPSRFAGVALLRSREGPTLFGAATDLLAFVPTQPSGVTPAALPLVRIAEVERILLLV
jgi:hypothetical protein